MAKFRASFLLFKKKLTAFFKNEVFDLRKRALLSSKIDVSDLNKERSLILKKKEVFDAEKGLSYLHKKSEKRS